MCYIPSRSNSVTLVAETHLHNQTPHASPLLESVALLVKMVSEATAVCSMLQRLVTATQQLTGKH